MNPTQVAVVLDRLATAFNRRLTSEDLEVWSDALDDLDVQMSTEALDALIRNHDGFMPTVARFRQAYNEIARTRARERRETTVGGPNPDCGLCGGTEWVEVMSAKHADPETSEVRVDATTVRPCQFCFPEGYRRYLEDLPRRKTMHERFSPPDLLDYDPRAALEAAAQALR